MIRAAGGVLWRYAAPSEDAAERGPEDAPEGATEIAPELAPEGATEAASETASRAGALQPGIEIAVLHRPKYDDWSLPKGKAKSGEQPWLTALREIAEETGLDPVLMAPLGYVRYRFDGEKKQVDYWLARVGHESEPAVKARPSKLRGKAALESKRSRDAEAGRAAPEVDAIVWLPLKQARSKLSYKTDRTILARAAKLISKGALDSYCVAFVRHSKAVERIDWDDGERTRPLTGKGKAQAGRVTQLLSAWGANRLVSSPWKRCMQTIRPYSELSGVPILEVPDLTEDAWDLDVTGVVDAVRAALGSAPSPVASSTAPERTLPSRSLPSAYALCLHGPTLVAVLDVLSGMATRKVRATLPEGPWRKGEVLIAHVAKLPKGKRKIIAAELWRP